MGILMAGLSPHPPIIIPQIGGDERQKISRTINSLHELAAEVKRLEPDLLITISPHGPVFKDAVSILDQLKLVGDFADFGHPEVSFEVQSFPAFINELKLRASQEGQEVITLSAKQLEHLVISTKLDHGVLVPLYFLKKAGLNVPLVPLTMGLMSYQKLFDFGMLIQKTLYDMGLNGVVIASGDLSHRLEPGAPAGFNPKGKIFDQTVVELLRKKDFNGILNIEQSLIEKAGECGLRPLIIMLGSISGLEFEVEVKSYEGPFGVGYAVVSFYRKELSNGN